ncbi:MAG: hypothetical protein P8J27_16285, partial [Mariniblastus sp.]|nr:hypothetical protein [Mariniblastus sp.]
MSLRYLFPCPQCGNEFELVSKQAGQQLVCAKCGSPTVAPKLGSLRQLETLGQEANISANSGSGGLRNLLFVCGLGLAILAGIGGYFLYQYAESKITEFDVNKTMDTFDVWADDQPPSVVAQ